MYCPECAGEAVSEKVKQAKRQWAEDRQHEIREQKSEKRKDRRVCAVCGKPFSSPTPTVTCSPACAAEQKRRMQAIADVKRGRARPDRVLSKLEHTNPQSVIPGITWHKGKWQLTIKGKYIGLFQTIEEAKAKKKSMEENQL